jgi:molybdopterin molybdotransferase
MASLTPVDEALALVLGRAQRLPLEDVPVGESAGRIAASDTHAPVDLPPFPSSAMDGFAVRAADTPGALRVVDTAAAGLPASSALSRGEAIAISTGGVVPDGADTVVPVERVSEEGDVVTVPAVTPGANIRPRAGDVRAGNVVIAAGTVVTPARLAALAACGLATIRCARRPRATVLTTGTELRAPGEPLRPGEIYESNGPMLEALLRRAGCDVTRLHPVADDPQAHRLAIERALSADLVVTSGGVSMGRYDLVRSTLAGLGVEEVFWGIAMRPGKPLAFGAHGDTLVFGLPGNPVSSLVGAVLFVVPAALARQGAQSPGPHFRRGALASPAARSVHRDDFVRAIASPDGLVTPIPRQESHMIVAAAEADAIVRIPAGDGELSAGSAVDYLALDGPPTGA